MSNVHCNLLYHTNNAVPHSPISSRPGDTPSSTGRPPEMGRLGIEIQERDHQTRFSNVRRTARFRQGLLSTGALDRFGTSIQVSALPVSRPVVMQQ